MLEDVDLKIANGKIHVQKDGNVKIEIECSIDFLEDNVNDLNRLVSEFYWNLENENEITQGLEKYICD